MSAPIMDDREAMHRERSRRYAEALAAAAATDARVKELTEKLEEAEYFRRIAEDEAGAAHWLDSSDEPWASAFDRHIYHAGDPEPGENVEFLFSLGDSTILQASRWGDDRDRHGWHILSYESPNASSYSDWGGALEHAPLIAITKDADLGLTSLARLVNKHVADFAELRRRLPRDPESNAWSQPDLPERLSILELRYAEQTTELRDKLQHAQSEGLRYFVERFAEAIRSGNQQQMESVLSHWDEVAARS